MVLKEEPLALLGNKFDGKLKQVVFVQAVVKRRLATKMREQMLDDTPKSKYFTHEDFKETLKLKTKVEKTE